MMYSHRNVESVVPCEESSGHSLCQARIAVAEKNILYRPLNLPFIFYSILLQSLMIYYVVHSRNIGTAIIRNLSFLGLQNDLCTSSSSTEQ